MHKFKLLIILLLTPWIATFAQTATKPVVHHTAKPALSPVDAAMKSLATLLSNTQTTGTYVGKIEDQGGRDSTRYEQVSTAGCVLSYTKIYDWHGNHNEAHSVFSRSLDLKEAVLVQGVPNGWIGRAATKFDTSRSTPDVGFALKFVTPQPWSGTVATTDASGKVTEEPYTRPSDTTYLYATTPEEATSLQQALNQAILVCGGAANVAPPQPVAPPPAPKPPPRPSACSAEGPDLATTQKYIVDNSKRTTSLDDYSDDGKLYDFEETESQRKERYIIDYMSIDCNSTDVVNSKDGHLSVWLNCRNNLSCVRQQFWTTHYSEGEPYSYWIDYNVATLTEHGFQTQSGDIDLTRNLQRALMHYIFLLQQNFRSRHTNPNDPFAKPQ